MGSYNSDGDGEEIGAYAKHWELVGDVSPLPIAIPNGSDNINCGWMKSECKEDKSEKKKKNIYFLIRVIFKISGIKY